MVVMALAVAAVACSGGERDDVLTVVTHDAFLVSDDVVASFEEQTGINVEHTVVPWEDLEATYTANFAGGEPFDVTYQVSTHLTLFGEVGAFADVTPLIGGDDFATEIERFPQGIIDASVYISPWSSAAGSFGGRWRRRHSQAWSAA